MAHLKITTRTMRRLAAAAAAGCASAGALALPGLNQAGAGAALGGGAAASQHCITSPGLGTDDLPLWGEGVIDPYFLD
jgi:hypothetical protein